MHKDPSEAAQPVDHNFTVGICDQSTSISLAAGCGIAKSAEPEFLHVGPEHSSLILGNATVAAYLHKSLMTAWWACICSSQRGGFVACSAAARCSNASLGSAVSAATTRRGTKGRKTLRASVVQALRLKGCLNTKCLQHLVVCFLICQQRVSLPGIVAAVSSAAGSFSVTMLRASRG